MQAYAQTTPKPIDFNINLVQPSRFRDLAEFVNAISGYILQLAIPLAVVLIIYAGVKFILARGNIGEVSKAKQILWYVFIGLAIVLIGRGFISLITSLISLPSAQGN